MFSLKRLPLLPASDVLCLLTPPYFEFLVYTVSDFPAVRAAYSFLLGGNVGSLAEISL